MPYLWTTLHIKNMETSVQFYTIISPNPMMKFFYATDPDGLKVQFVQDLRKK